MAVYAEWHWSCDECDEHSQEPWLGDPDGAQDEYDEHMRTDHPNLSVPSTKENDHA